MIIFGPKKFGWKNFVSEIFFVQYIFGQKNLFQKTFGPKNFVQKICGSKKVLGSKNLGAKNFWVQNICRVQNSDSWDIPIDLCRQDKCCLDKCHCDSWYLLKMVPETYL